MGAASSPSPGLVPPVTAIADVIARMVAIDGRLVRRDGVAYFNRLYLQVTRSVLTAAASTTFEDGAFVDRLDVVFATLYFLAEETVENGGSCSPAWRPLFDERAAGRAPIQYALAGMNAHINHDLPLALVQTMTELGIAPDDDSPAYRDYDRVNAILKTVETQVAAWFENGLVADIEDVIPKQVDYALAMWSIVTARELAWEHAQALWGLRGDHLLFDAYEDTLARSVELSSLGMLV